VRLKVRRHAGPDLLFKPCTEMTVVMIGVVWGKVECESRASDLHYS